MIELPDEDGGEREAWQLLETVGNFLAARSFTDERIAILRRRVDAALARHDDAVRHPHQDVGRQAAIDRAVGVMRDSEYVGGPSQRDAWREAFAVLAPFATEHKAANREQVDLLAAPNEQER